MCHKYLWEILVPTVNNIGKINDEYHHLWDEEVIKISGGLTVFKSAAGYWKDTCKISPIRERMIPVRIFCSLEEIQNISDFTAKYYKQKAVMYYKISNEVYIENYV